MPNTPAADPAVTVPMVISAISFVLMLLGAYWSYQRVSIPAIKERILSTFNQEIRDKLIATVVTRVDEKMTARFDALRQSHRADRSEERLAVEKQLNDITSALARLRSRVDVFDAEFQGIAQNAVYKHDLNEIKTDVKVLMSRVNDLRGLLAVRSSNGSN